MGTCGPCLKWFDLGSKRSGVKSKTQAQRRQKSQGCGLWMVVKVHKQVSHVRKVVVNCDDTVLDVKRQVAASIGEPVQNLHFGSYPDYACVRDLLHDERNQRITYKDEDSDEEEDKVEVDDEKDLQDWLVKNAQDKDKGKSKKNSKSPEKDLHDLLETTIKSALTKPTKSQENPLASAMFDDKEKRDEKAKEKDKDKNKEKDGDQEDESTHNRNVLIMPCTISDVEADPLEVLDFTEKKKVGSDGLGKDQLIKQLQAQVTQLTATVKQLQSQQNQSKDKAFPLLQEQIRDYEKKWKASELQVKEKERLIIKATRDIEIQEQDHAHRVSKLDSEVDHLSQSQEFWQSRAVKLERQLKLKTSLVNRFKDKNTRLERQISELTLASSSLSVSSESDIDPIENM